MNATTTATAPRWIAYYRVSTRKQSNGIDAQKAVICAMASAEGATIIDAVEEKESGKECDRPGLARAMALARHHRAAVVVAKPDRLSRDLAFAAEVVFKSGVSFRILGMPEEAMTNQLLFGVYYGLAAEEATMISVRTKAALAVRKAAGVKLGNPNGAAALRREGVADRSKATRRAAALDNDNNRAAARAIRAALEEATGKKPTLQALADHLTASGIYTARGNFHTRQSVKNLCALFGIDLAA